LRQRLRRHGLSLVEIPADGHCLFSAISDQLKRTKCTSDLLHSYKTLRRAAAEYMLSNKKDFCDFLSLENDTFEVRGACWRLRSCAFFWGGVW
jgi:hypothetical protein